MGKGKEFAKQGFANEVISSDRPQSCIHRQKSKRAAIQVQRSDSGEESKDGFGD